MYAPQPKFLGHCRATVIQPKTFSVQFSKKGYDKVISARKPVEFMDVEMRWLCTEPRRKAPKQYYMRKIEGVCPEVQQPEQRKPDGVPVTCAPELKANNHKAVDISWNSIDVIRRKMIDSRNRPDNCNWIMAFNKAIYSEVSPPINFTHLWVTRDTNENTNRVC